MRWAMPLYKESPALKYINRLDLSSGNELLKKCDSICNWYSEVILNRKSFIKYLVEKELSAEGEYQLVFMAAGKSPLPIELLFNNHSKIHRVFEIDLSGMENKNALYIELFPDLSNKLRCITGDITSPGIINILYDHGNGYRRDIPSIIVMEGISYYLHKLELQNIVSHFCSNRENIFIIEYLLPDSYVIQERQFISRKIFATIRKECGLSDITEYTRDELKNIFRKTGGDLISGYSMSDMEFNRTGVYRYFKKPEDGWIECAIGVTGPDSK